MVNENFELAKSSTPESLDSLITVQVVVHIVYNTANQNLPDSIIFNQMKTLNEDFQRLNSDTINMNPVFGIIKGNPNIKFVLATQDPFGNPTTGITRTATSTISFGSNLFFSFIYTDLEKIKQTSNGGIDPWDQSRYLNIWVGNMEIFNQQFIQGYATPPLNLPNWQNGPSLAGISDGVVIQYQYFGSNNPNSIIINGTPEVNKGRILTHEVGHYLGLRHIWADDAGCGNQDGVDDTPNSTVSSNFTCPLPKNTCADTILGIDLPDMSENYMDYSKQTCTNSFTKGQAGLMRSILLNQRPNLILGTPKDLGNFFTNDFLIYPNPASSILNLNLLQGTNHYVSIKNYLGQTIQLANNQNRIDISNLINGIYFISIQQGQNTITQKFVKQ